MVPLLGAAHATCSPRGCKTSEYVVFDADEEPPGASSNGADSMTHPFGVCDDTTRARRHFGSIASSSTGV